MITLLFLSAMLGTLPIVPLLAEPARSYDTAVVCKAFSLLAMSSSDDTSKAALAAIEAEIERDSAKTGRTPEQAAADVEYSRYELKDLASEQSFFDAEWAKCLTLWSR